MAPETETRYEGRAQLEAMAQAVRYNRYLAELIHRFAEDTTSVLDFGAGLGTFSGSLPIPPAQVTCVEPDTEARGALAARGFRSAGTLDDLPDGGFSYAFTLNVLEHIEDDAAAVAGLYRVLAPGGRLFVYVPAFALLYTAMDAAVGHHRRYRARGLTALLRDAGFRIEHARYADALGFFATLAYRTFDRRRTGALDPRTVAFYDRWVFPASRVLSVPLGRILGKNLWVVGRREG
ncbi:MAG: class I SAM-dependent methyltransferase [Acidiferrobacteraceae bacterium]